jgi:hypothetical protein
VWARLKGAVVQRLFVIIQKSNMTTTLTPEQLVFAPPSGGDVSWHAISSTAPFGTVGYVTYDRGDEYNLFVVVGHNTDGETIDVVFPRIRVVDGEVVLGCDKITEKGDYEHPCTCPEPTQGDCFWCTCGAAKITRERYGATFERAGKDTRYAIHTFSTREWGWDDIYVHIGVERLCYLDIPLWKHNCGGKVKISGFANPGDNRASM